MWVVRSHYYCKERIKELFHHAKINELFPPRCCRDEIPISIVELLPDPKSLQIFKRKAIEYNTINRANCYDTNYREFMSAKNMIRGKATYKVCGKSTCFLCESSAHEDGCSIDFASKGLMQTPKLWNIWALSSSPGFKLFSMGKIERVSLCSYL